MTTDALIIGAGIYGISLANYLAARGKQFVLAGEYMDLWRNHTFDGMTLRSDFRLSEIAHPENKFSSVHFLREFPEYAGYETKHLPVEIFRRYLDWVRANIDYEIVRDRVIRLAQNPGGAFEAALAGGRMIRARRVIIATGSAAHCRIPPEFESVKEKVVHSYDTASVSAMRRSKVLVVGSGQSAAECIEELLRNDNRVEWYSRKAPVYFEQPVNLPPWIFNGLVKSPGFFRRLPEVARHAVNRLIEASTVIPAYRNILAGQFHYNYLPELSAYERIVCATGYDFRISNLEFLSQPLKLAVAGRKDKPYLNGNFESSVNGLYFCGPVSGEYFGAATRFIVGARYSSKQISLEF